MAQILGIDAGNSRVKVFGGAGELSFMSHRYPYQTLNLDGAVDKDDVEYIIYEYEGQKWLAGQLAVEESGGRSAAKKGESKAHEETLIRVLLAIHRYITFKNISETKFKIVVGQPIENHKRDKEAIKDMLEGTHTIALEIKGEMVPKTFTIQRCEVVAEGASAYLAEPREGLLRYIDFGSGTVNGVTVKNGSYVNGQSFTEPYGVETKNMTKTALVELTLARTSEIWDRDDTVFVVGGVAEDEEILNGLRKDYPNAQPLRPRVLYGDTVTQYPPIWANAIGMYNLARSLYK